MNMEYFMQLLTPAIFNELRQKRALQKKLPKSLTSIKNLFLRLRKTSQTTSNTLCSATESKNCDQGINNYLNSSCTTGKY